MSQDAAERPHCLKCGGYLFPRRDAITDRVTSVVCAGCGETLYRDHERRTPNRKETDTKAGKGVSRHDNPHTPRVSHKKRVAA